MDSLICFQYSDVKKACKDWNYPETIVMNKDKDKSDIFYEGDFLHMLLEKLSNLLDQVTHIILNKTGTPQPLYDIIVGVHSINRVS